MEHTAYWPKAFGISCIAHLIVFASLGLIAGQMDVQKSPVEYMMVDLSQTPLVSGGGGSALAAIVQPMSVATAAHSTAAVAPAASPKSSSIQPEISNASQTSETGLVGAVGGDLRVASDNPVSGIAAAISGGDATARNADRLTGSTTSIGSGAGEGSGQGSGFGAASGPGIDSAILAFLSEVEKRKEYPYIARKRGHEGVVTLIVELTEAGELNRVQVAQSSGFSQLDEAAASAIRRVCPFAHGLVRPVRMKIPISYRLVE